MNRIKKKFIENNAVDGSKILFLNDEIMRARNAANSADVSLMKLDASDKLQFLTLPQVSSDPSDGNDLARKSWVDAEIAATTSDLTALEGRVDAIEADYGVAGGLATLGLDGKIPSSQIPALAISEVYVVANIAARDALSGIESGDVAKVTDAGAGLPRTYIYDGSSWIEIESGSDVDSVNGYTGTVVLATSDVAESGLTNRYYTPTRQSSMEAYADQAEADAISSANSYTDSEVLAVQNELDATQFGAGLGTDGSYSTPIGSNYLNSAVSLKDADSKLDTEVKVVADGLAQEILDRAADVDAEESARIAEDLTFFKLDGSRVASYIDISGSGFDSGLYPDMLSIYDNSDDVNVQLNKNSIQFSDQATISASSTLSLSAGTEVSMLSEVNMNSNKIVGVLNGTNASDAVNKGQLDSVETALAGDIAAEESRALAAEGVLSGRITALEGVAVQFSSEKFILSATNISNGYIDLAHIAVGNSMNAFVDRLAIFETDDYTLSVVGGVTRLTFAGSLITAGQEKLSAGDEVRVKYAYEVL